MIDNHVPQPNTRTVTRWESKLKETPEFIICCFDTSKRHYARCIVGIFSDARVAVLRSDFVAHEGTNYAAQEFIPRSAIPTVERYERPISVLKPATHVDCIDWSLLMPGAPQSDPLNLCYAAALTVAQKRCGGSYDFINAPLALKAVKVNIVE